MKNPGELSTPRTAQKKIAITRPVGKGDQTSQFVKKTGWIPFVFHTVELKPSTHAEILDQVRLSLEKGPPDWVVFMSESGVKLTFKIITDVLKEAHSQESRLLAVGPKTRGALVRQGATQVSVPKKYSSEGVAEFFSSLDLRNQRIVLVRSSSADGLLASSLAKKGAATKTINAYESSLPRDPQSALDFLDGLSANSFSAILFTSAISVSNLFKLAAPKFSETDLTHRLSQVPLGAIGPATARELQKRGIEPITPDRYLIPNAILKLVASAGEHVKTAAA